MGPDAAKQFDEVYNDEYEDDQAHAAKHYLSEAQMAEMAMRKKQTPLNKTYSDAVDSQYLNVNMNLSKNLSADSDDEVVHNMQTQGYIGDDGDDGFHPQDEYHREMDHLPVSKKSTMHSECKDELSVDIVDYVETQGADHNHAEEDIYDVAAKITIGADDQGDDDDEDEDDIYGMPEEDNATNADNMEYADYEDGNDDEYEY